MMNTPRHRFAAQGVTLVELLIAVAVIAVILVIAAPSFRDMVLMQRLRGTTAQLVTDLQFARNEAVSRGTLLRLSFRTNASMTCYTLYTSSVRDNRCDCRLGPGAACVNENVEIRTVQVPRSLAVQVAIPATEFGSAFAFDNVTGGLYVIPIDDAEGPFDGIRVESFIDNARKLVVRINRSGRPLVCTPTGSTMTEPACLP